MNTILVQMSERRWTIQALHLACALARNHQAEVILLRLIQVQHLSYLGTDFGRTEPTQQEYQLIAECAATAEDYGVVLSQRNMQCVTLLDSVVNAAEQLSAEMVFAHIPQSRIPYWRKFQIWNLERRLTACQRQLFTLDQPTKLTEQSTSIAITRAANLVRTTSGHGSIGK